MVTGEGYTAEMVRNRRRPRSSHEREAFIMA